MIGAKNSMKIDCVNAKATTPTKALTIQIAAESRVLLDFDMTSSDRRCSLKGSLGESKTASSHAQAPLCLSKMKLQGIAVLGSIAPPPGIRHTTMNYSEPSGSRHVFTEPLTNELRAKPVVQIHYGL
jgi:hypothetical protein